MAKYVFPQDGIVEVPRPVVQEHRMTKTTALTINVDDLKQALAHIPNIHSISVDTPGQYTHTFTFDAPIPYGESKIESIQYDEVRPLK
jgi:hypothetical protein